MLAVLRREPAAPVDLREKSLYLAARLLEMTGAVPPSGGYRAAQEALAKRRPISDRRISGTRSPGVATGTARVT